jgi:hypothetical protein
VFASTTIPLRCRYPSASIHAGSVKRDRTLNSLAMLCLGRPYTSLCSLESNMVAHITRSFSLSDENQGLPGYALMMSFHPQLAYAATIQFLLGDRLPNETLPSRYVSTNGCIRAHFLLHLQVISVQEAFSLGVRPCWVNNASA